MLGNELLCLIAAQPPYQSVQKSAARLGQTNAPANYTQQSLAVSKSLSRDRGLLRTNVNHGGAPRGPRKHRCNICGPSAFILCSSPEGSGQAEAIAAAADDGLDPAAGDADTTSRLKVACPKVSVAKAGTELPAAADATCPPLTSGGRNSVSRTCQTSCHVRLAAMVSMKALSWARSTMRETTPRLQWDNKHKASIPQSPSAPVSTAAQP